MKKMSKTILKLGIVLVITIGLTIALSIPFGLFPALGKFLFPGNGSVWTVPDDVVKQETLTTDALENDVTIFRDQWGVPHIYGYSEQDLAFALGYVQAQDRLIQMDLARRSTRGKLAEILGEDALASDEFSLNKLKDYWAVESFKALQESEDPVDQIILDTLLSYSAGINYYIKNTNKLPLEFLFLGYKPDPWSPVDTLSFVKYMSEMLTWSYQDFTTLELFDAVGLDIYNDLFGYPLPYQIPVTVNYGEYQSQMIPQNVKDMKEAINSADNQGVEDISLIFQNLLSNIEKIPGEKEFIHNSQLVGSNNWVANGSKTESGMPILCNDMHLGYNLPGIWYEAHLVDLSSDFNVYGFFLAGVPYQIVGHNAYVAWGMTNTGIDVLDWYYYKGINETHYWYKNTPTAYGHIEYDINVKGREPEHFVIKTTVHGPVFNNLIDQEDYSGYINDVIACKWISHNTTQESRAIYGWSHAKNRNDFDEASKFFSTPAQNIVYADIHGHIGIRPTGVIPIRDDSSIPAWNFGNGTMPYNGTAGEGEWIGYIPFDNLPHSENPLQGYLASANQISAGPEYLANYTIQNPLSIDEGYRARRINELLANDNLITIDDMKAIQQDTYSIRAGNFTPIFVSAITSLSSKTQVQDDALTKLIDWDYWMDKDTSAPTIFVVLMEVYKEETFGDELHMLESPRMPSDARLEYYTRTNSTSLWFDNINTPEIENRDDIIQLSFVKTINALEDFFGTSDVDTWKFGDINKLYFPHLTGFSALSSGPYDVSGCDDTVNVIWNDHYWFEDEVHISIATGGPSERLIVDLGNLNNSLSVIPSGQRGVSTSIHYTDQLEMFLNGEYHPQYFLNNKIEDFLSSWIESTIFMKAGGG